MTTTPRIAMHGAVDLKQSSVAPWNVAAEDFPCNGSKQEKWKFFLRYAVLAPSSHNTQPWLFHFDGADLQLRADRTRACHVVDPDDRELIISCGCALYHLRSAMAHFGYLGWIDLLPNSNDRDLLARITLGVQKENSAEEGLLFHAITKRRTNRQPFREEPIPLALTEALKNAAKSQSAWLRIVQGEEQRHAAAHLIAEGDRRQWSNKSFRHELAAWVHSNRTKARDGIPGYAQGVDDLMSCAGPLVVRTFNMGAGQAAKDQGLAAGSPVLAVLGTDGETPRDWLQAGQALARVLLRARVEDVWASFLNQAIELPDLRQRFCTALALKGHPQLCLRFGFGEDIRPTPRHDVQEKLI
jgi:hypothetical protein